MTVRRLLADRSAASAAEFGLVLPLVILMLFGVIDAGRFLWEFNRAEKATAAGARVAVVTNALPGGLQSANYVGVAGLTQGDRIPASALGVITCTSTACTCTTTPCPTLGTFDTNNVFGTVILPRMQAMKGDIAAPNVRVSYSGSGLGYAGDPNGMEISPLVTVSLTGLRFDPLILFGAGDFIMPDFRTTLTAEDSAGSQSN
jgi:Flp pilus assembly protein TadG